MTSHEAISIIRKHTKAPSGCTLNTNELVDAADQLADMFESIEEAFNRSRARAEFIKDSIKDMLHDLPRTC